MVNIDTCHIFRRYALAQILSIETSVGVSTNTAAIAQIHVNNVNTIHELYSENELATKNQYNGKLALVYGRVDRIDNNYLIVEGEVNLDVYSASLAMLI